MAPYKLYTDKQANFECKVELEGASVSSAVARLIVESNGDSLLYSGKISSNGMCSIPISKLRTKFKDGDTGTMKLEIIAEDTYFQPWSSEFVVTASKKAIVEIFTGKPKKVKAAKVEVVNSEDKMISQLVKEISTPLKNKGYTAESLNNKRNKKVVVEYIKTKLSKIDDGVDKSAVVNRVIKELAHK